MCWDHHDIIVIEAIRGIVQIDSWAPGLDRDPRNRYA